MPPAEVSGSVAGVLLAAGASTRMGRNKLLLPLEGETVVRRAVRRALAAGLEPVIVVLGHEADRTRRELSGLPCQAVLNAEHVGGVNVSLRVGISRVPVEACAAVVILPDMPFVTAQMIATLVRTYREGAPPLVVSRYGEVNAPPILYGRPLFAELQAMDGQGCGKQVVRRHRGEALVVPWPEAALADLDGPEDYDRVKAQLGEQ